MGLRLNTNVSTVISLNNLRRANETQRLSLSRMSSGDAIASSADNPSGLVISEVLRAQLGSLEQARENSEFASNVVGTADAALAEVESLLRGIRQSLVFALNDGAISPEPIDAEQDSVDSAIRSIERIANTTRLGDSNLLNGTSAIAVSDKSAAISEISARSVKLNGENSRTFEVSVAAAAERATIIAQFDTATGTADGDHTIQVTGALGTQELLVTSGMTTQDMMNAINSARDMTGVYATLASGTLGTPAAGDAMLLQSDEYGSEQEVLLTLLDGTNLYAAPEADGTPALLADGARVRDTGADVLAGVLGMNVDAKGNEISVISDQLNANITLADGTGPTGGTPLSFTVLDSGFTFQLNTGLSLHDSVTLGIDNVAPMLLGTAARIQGGTGSGTSFAEASVGGYINSILNGGANDLNTNPGNAIEIVDSAIYDVADLRSFLGAFESRIVESNLNSLDVAFENLVSSESEVRDVDFARESAEFTRAAIQAQAATSVFGSSNIISVNVLSLLQ